MYVTFSNWDNGLQLGKRAPSGKTGSNWANGLQPGKRAPTGKMGSNWENGQQYRAFLTRREYDR